MEEVNESVLLKWDKLVQACKAYYIDNVPTGMLDMEYDDLENQAAKEGFYVRDYIFDKYLKGTKTKNAWIERIKKTKVKDKTMLEALSEIEKSNGPLWYVPKYDGASLAIYLNPVTGRPIRVVTVGNLNLEDYGVDQTWKLLKFLPKYFPRGIVAIQAEALIDLTRFSVSDPETARQKANGLINSKYKSDEVGSLLTIRAYRYYTDNSPQGIFLKTQCSYRQVLDMFESVYSMADGHILFAPAQESTLQELINFGKDYCEVDRVYTETGKFLVDGWVVYNNEGTCLGAFKHPGAGSSTEGVIKTTVKSIQWNSQISKGKDSWSANVIIDPVKIKGVEIKKPSAGSVGKMVKCNITPGAEVSIILANSTIPMIGECFKPGNGDFSWPVCSCGYKMSNSDVYSSLLKCGNQMCIEREGRMKSYLSSLSNFPNDLDLDKFLVIDRFKWKETNIDINKLISFKSENEFFEYLNSFLSTELQKRNLNLVSPAAWRVLSEYLLSI